MVPIKVPVFRRKIKEIVNHERTKLGTVNGPV
jgi:hypothetical protein